MLDCSAPHLCTGPHASAISAASSNIKLPWITIVGRQGYMHVQTEPSKGGHASLAAAAVAMQVKCGFHDHVPLGDGRQHISGLHRPIASMMTHNEALTFHLCVHQITTVIPTFDGCSNEPGWSSTVKPFRFKSCCEFDASSLFPIEKRQLSIHQSLHL